MLPVWAQVIIGIAAALTASTVIWTKGVRPIYRFASKAEEMVPLMVDLTSTFRDTPEAFQILNQIVAQFRTDSGSSLRDVVNRLEDASTQNVRSNELLRVAAMSAKDMADRDRQQIDRLVILLDRLTISQARAEDATGKVASNLVVAQIAVDDVARDLAESHKRADAVGGVPGEAADAAAQQTVQEKKDDQ